MSDKISAVSDKDLVKLLKSLNLLDKINSNELKCSHCNDIITLDSVGCIYPYDNKINICCDRLSCYQSVLELISSHEITVDVDGDIV